MFYSANFFLRSETFLFRLIFWKTKKKLGKSWGNFFFDIEILKNVCNFFVFQTKTKRNEVFFRGKKNTKCSIIKKTKRWHPEYCLTLFVDCLTLFVYSRTLLCTSWHFLFVYTVIQETESLSSRNGTLDTESTLMFIPQPADHGTTIACRKEKTKKTLRQV